MRMLLLIMALLLIPTSVFCAPPPQLAELTASDGNYSDEFGRDVAISGKTVVVGAPLATVGSVYEQGKAYIFVKPESGWSNMTQVAELTPSDGSQQLEFGVSAAIAAGGNTIVIGSTGGAYIFVKPKNGWTNMTETAELS